MKTCMLILLLKWDGLMVLYISVKMYTEDEWQQHSFTLFYHNVQKDGVEIF
jgi:hypothetical protein